MDESAMGSNWTDVTFVAWKQHLIKILKIDEQFSILSKWIPPLTAEGPLNILILPLWISSFQNNLNIWLNFNLCYSEFACWA